jgi:hypothetical protein
MTPEYVYVFSVGFVCGIAMAALTRGVAVMTTALRKPDDDWRVLSRRGRD